MYVFSLALLIYISSLFQPLIAFVSTLVWNKRRISLIEVFIAIISSLILFHLGKGYLVSFTLRAITLVNLYLISSQLVDIKSLINLTKGRAVPVIVAMAYYPYFYDVVKDIANYAKARGVKIYRLDKILLPIVVFIVKTAEDLYLTMTLKLNGKYKGKFEIKPRKNDIVLLIYGVVTICLSLSLHF